jgi:regulatory protein
MNLRIKEVIKERGTTITELADKMGINRVNLSNMVNGNPTVETLNKIADAIGCQVTELFEQPKKDNLSITCPHCGKDIEIKVENVQKEVKDE